jgi:2-oxo-4-hydroxy-4-carboxy-5-ureidoimidazoline decarboxylase
MEPWRRLDEADPVDARDLLRACCGSTAWVERMVARRPFGDRPSLLAAARAEWLALGEEDWREAFAQHPKIGDRAALERRFAATRYLSEEEQKGVDGAGEDVLTALADGNRFYEQTFGYIFIVCASGRSAREMLALLRARLENEPATEIRVAASEQADITALRLDGLGTKSPGSGIRDPGGRQ